jgi:hypothetical protein
MANQYLRHLPLTFYLELCNKRRGKILTPMGDLRSGETIIHTHNPQIIELGALQAEGREGGRQRQLREFKGYRQMHKVAFKRATVWMSKSSKHDFPTVFCKAIQVQSAVYSTVEYSSQRNIGRESDCRMDGHFTAYRI